MLADIIVKAAGFEKQQSSAYYPRPSLAGAERCIRQMVYSGTKAPMDKERSDRFIMILDDSSWHEELSADWMQKTAFVLNSQQMVINIADLPFMAPGLRHCRQCGENVPTGILHGHIDGVITDLLGQDYLWEHKAINHFTFEKYWKGGWPVDYITQCCLYIVGLSKINPDISKAVLLIKNKNTSQYIDFLINYDAKADTATISQATHSNGEERHNKDGSPLLTLENIVSETILKFETAHRHIQSGTLPDRPYEIGTTFPCSYCSWEHTCWFGYEKEYAKLDSDAVLEGDIIDLARYYLELNGHLLGMNKEKEELKSKIKGILSDAKVSKGRAGEYVIANTLRSSKVLNKDMLPADILIGATEIKRNETLTIRKPKKKGDVCKKGNR